MAVNYDLICGIDVILLEFRNNNKKLDNVSLSG